MAEFDLSGLASQRKAQTRFGAGLGQPEFTNGRHAPKRSVQAPLRRDPATGL